MFNLITRKIDDGCMVAVLPGEPKEDRRIKQEGQKGETCILVAMELIAKLQNTPYQMNEQMRSYLVSCKEFGFKFQVRVGVINFLKQKVDFSQKKEKVVQLVKEAIGRLSHTGPIDKRSTKDDTADNALSDLSTIFDNYANSMSEDFDQYVQDLHNHKRIDIKLDLLTQSGINPSEKFEEIILEHRAFPSMPSCLNEASLADRSHCLDSMIMNMWKDVFHLEYSPWAPDKPIADLIELINNKGLQVVFGHIGIPFYDASKIKVMLQNTEYTIYGWPSGAYEKKNLVGHAIILVGAQAKGQEVVYFMDPIDAPRKIYMMSYKLLCNNAMDYRGILNADIPKHDTVQRKFSLMIS